MERFLKIATKHSSRIPRKQIKVKLEGGSPWFAYIWLDDVCYTIRKHDTGRVYKIEKTK